MPLLISTKDVGLSPDLRNKLSALGISANSFDDLIELIVEAATKPTETETISIGDLPSEARTFGLGGGSSQAVKITDKTFAWSSNDLVFTYDANNVKKAVADAGMTYVGTNVTLTGKGRTAARTSAGSLSLPEGVSQAKVEITALTDVGTVILEKVFPVSPSSSGTVVLSTNDQSAAPSSLTYREHLELLSSKLATIEQKI
jgi:hypothetical protein